MAYPYGFNNGQVLAPTSGCGVGSLPGVAVFNPEVTCPGAGFGASTYASPATPLALGLTTAIAKFVFASSAAERNILIGDFSEHCTDVIETEAGVTTVNLCDEGVAVPNTQGNIFCCFIESGAQMIFGVVLKSNGQFDNVSATQVLFQPCNPCFTSDTDFVCTNGCNDNSNFILTNAVAGRNAGLIINLPATTSNVTLEICTCAPEVNSFATCPVQIPAVAQIAAGPACPPAADFAAPALGNGAAIYAGQR